jgi:hypothetical protein
MDSRRDLSETDVQYLQDMIIYRKKMAQFHEKMRVWEQLMAERCLAQLNGRKSGIQPVLPRSPPPEPEHPDGSNKVLVVSRDNPFFSSFF